jgi:hypothetical protein
MITRRTFKTLLGSEGDLLFHRIACKHEQRLRAVILKDAIKYGTMTVVKAWDDTRLYLPNGEVFWDSAEHMN